MRGGLSTALVIVFGTTVLALEGFVVWRLRVEREAAVVARAPSARVAEPTMEKVPTELPLRGVDGRDAAGMTTRWVDRPAMRSLLRARKIDALTRYFEELQSSFEDDARFEQWPADAADAFATEEPDLRASLDAWVAMKPASFAPYLARASHFARLGATALGAQAAGEREEALAAARRDVETALRLRPRLAAAARLSVRLARSGELEEVERAAYHACRACLGWRVELMHRLTPGAGGSHREMDALAARAAREGPTRLGALAGYVAWDRARTSLARGDTDAALRIVDEATGSGEHAELVALRGEILRARGDRDAALRAFTRATELRPGDPSLLAERAWAEAARGHAEAAGATLLVVLRSDPTHRRGLELLTPALDALLAESSKLQAAGRIDDATRVADLAFDLAPRHDRVLEQRTKLIVGAGRQPDSPRVAELLGAIQRSPDDLVAHQQLDGELARTRQWDRIIRMWDGYLLDHPADPVALRERSGAKWQAGLREGALDDAQRSCRLGDAQSCAWLRRVGR